MTARKLTTRLLKKIIEEEVHKFGEPQDPEDVADDVEEFDADELADSVEKQIDFVKALKIEENRVVKRLAKIREAKARSLKKLVKSVSLTQGEYHVCHRKIHDVCTPSQ